MKKRNCKNCLYGDICPFGRVCEYYAPIKDDDGTDEYIDSERREFYKEWLRYTSEDDG